MTIKLRIKLSMKRMNLLVKLGAIVALWLGVMPCDTPTCRPLVDKGDKVLPKVEKVQVSPQARSQYMTISLGGSGEDELDARAMLRSGGDRISNNPNLGFKGRDDDDPKVKVLVEVPDLVSITDKDIPIYLYAKKGVTITKAEWELKEKGNKEDPKDGNFTLDRKKYRNRDSSGFKRLNSQDEPLVIAKNSSLHDKLEIHIKFEEEAYPEYDRVLFYTVDGRNTLAGSAKEPVLYLLVKKWNPTYLFGPKFDYTPEPNIEIYLNGTFSRAHYGSPQKNPGADWPDDRYPSPAPPLDNDGISVEKFSLGGRVPLTHKGLKVGVVTRFRTPYMLEKLREQNPDRISRLHLKHFSFSPPSDLSQYVSRISILHWDNSHLEPFIGYLNEKTLIEYLPINEFERLASGTIF